MDSFKSKESAPKSYLTCEDWQSEAFLPELEESELFQDRLIYSPRVILEALEKAKDVLDSTPGPNIERRRELSNDWLGFWINFMSERLPMDTGFPYRISSNILSPEMIGYTSINTANQAISALWNAGGLEGGPHHRAAFDFVISNEKIFPVICLEKSTYIGLKDRKKPYLPLPLVMSLWSYYLASKGNRGYLTINTYPVSNYESLGDFLEELAKIMKLRTCFMNENDPIDVMFSKLLRYPTNGLIKIPHVDIPSTTERVQI